MNVYEVVGKGRDTGRTRKRQYTVESKDAAREYAEADGTIVESITDLGPEPFFPPSDAQLKYAADLGIWVPEGSSGKDLSLLISKALAAPDAELSLARSLGVDPPEYVSSEDLMRLILGTLGPSDLIRWYLFLVFLRRANQREAKKVQSPNDSILRALAENLEKDEAVLKSIRRNMNVFAFEGIEPSQTYAYKNAINALSPLLGSASSPPRNTRSERKTESNPRGENRADIGSAAKKNNISISLILFAVIALLLFWWL